MQSSEPPMSRFQAIRSWLQTHPQVVAILAIVVTIVAVASMLLRKTGPDPFADRVNVFYYDESTGAVSVRPFTDIPPLMGSDGKPSLVRAVFISYGSDEEKKLAYLEKYEDAAKAMLDKSIQENPLRTASIDALIGAEGGHLVRLPEPGSPWVRTGTPEAVEVRKATMPDAAHSEHFRMVNPQK